MIDSILVSRKKEKGKIVRCSIWCRALSQMATENKEKHEKLNPLVELVTDKLNYQ